MAKPENIEPLQLKESTLNGGTSKRVFPATYAKCVKVVVKVSDGSDGAVDLQTYLENLRQKIEEMGGGDIDIDMSDYPTQDDLQEAIDKAKDEMVGDIAEKAKDAVDELVGNGDIIDKETADGTYLKKEDADRDFATKDDLSKYLTQPEVLELILENMQGFAPDGNTFLTKDAADSYYAPIGNYLTEEALNGKGYVTSSTLEPYATKAYVDGKGYLTKEAADTYYAAKGDYITESDLDGKGYVTSSTLSTYATKAFVEGKGYLTSDDIANFKTEDQIRGIITGYNYLTKSDADTYYPTKTEFDTLKTTVDGWNTSMTEVTNLSNKFEAGFTGVANAVLYCNSSGKITADTSFTYNGSQVSANAYYEK